MEKMLPQEDNYLIRCNSEWGPIFGKNNDLRIADNCNKSNKSLANFPWTYNRENKKYVRGQESYCDFSGATQGYNFRVEEYEVFKVVWENNEK